MVVGLHNRKMVSTHKRTRSFMPEDFDLLMKNISGFDTRWITSHCMAEVSNLIGEPHKSKQAKELMVYFSQFTLGFKESHISKDIIFKDSISTRLGVTDAGLITKAKKVTCTITEDHALYHAILRRGYKVVNLNHLREKCWGYDSD